MRIGSLRGEQIQGRLPALRTPRYPFAGTPPKGPTCPEDPHKDDTPAFRAISAPTRQNTHSVAKRGQTLPGCKTCSHLT